MRTYVAEEFEGRTLFVLHRTAKRLVAVRVPEGIRVGDSWTGNIDWEHGEGPYALLDSPTTGHDQRLIQNWLIHPGQSLDDALAEQGLDEEALIPRY